MAADPPRKPSGDETDRKGSAASSGGIRVPRSVLIALQTMEVLSVAQPIGVGALAQELDLPKSTVQRTLYALRAAGYAYQTAPHSLWSLTLKVFQIGNRALQGFDLREVALPFLEDLRDETRESAYLSLLDGAETFIVERVESPLPVRAYVEVGTTFPMNCTAAGKAFMAAMSDEELEEALARELPALTDRSKTTTQELLQDVREARELGYAVNKGESRSEVAAVASVIPDSVGGALGAIVVAAPISRAGDDRLAELGIAASTTASEISVLVGNSRGVR